jgi:hypothetical protein
VFHCSNDAKPRLVSCKYAYKGCSGCADSVVASQMKGHSEFVDSALGSGVVVGRHGSSTQQGGHEHGMGCTYHVLQA